MLAPSQIKHHEPGVSTATLVIGLGNPIVADDAVGIEVARALRRSLADVPDIDVQEDYWGGLRLMERLAGYERAVVIDAICTGAPPGTVHLLSPQDMPTEHSVSAHDLSLIDALHLGRHAGVSVPDTDNIRLVGVEADDVLTFSESCTPAVQIAIPKAVQAVLAILREWDLPPQPRPST